MGSFTKKDLKFTITLGRSTFEGQVGNQLTIQGMRASVNIDSAGGMQMSHMSGRIYGLSMSDMNSMTWVQWLDPIGQGQNLISIYAIENTMETFVFNGTMFMTRGNFQGTPDVFLDIEAQTGLIPQLTPGVPLSFKGSVDVASIMERLASQMGYTFENNGVMTRCTDVYLCDTILNMAKQLVTMANIDMYFDGKILAICPKGQPRNVKMAPEISPRTGLIGYPMFDTRGVTFSTLFNPALRHGCLVNLVSDIKRANGTWQIATISHQLESEMPDGKWQSNILAVQPGKVVVST